MRTQYCREHIDAVAEGCGIDQDYVERVKSVTEFVDEHKLMSMCATRALFPLITIPDPEIKEVAISLVENALKAKTPSGGNKNQNLNENQIKAFRARAELQVQTARVKAIQEQRKAAEAEYKAAKKVADAEEEKRKAAEALGVVLKETDPEYETVKKPAMEELHRLNELLAYQKERRVEQETIYQKRKETHNTAVEYVGVCKENLKKAEEAVRNSLGYCKQIRKEIEAIDENTKQVVKQINELTEKVKGGNQNVR
jgi:hypothetical protein